MSDGPGRPCGLRHHKTFISMTTRLALFSTLSLCFSLHLSRTLRYICTSIGQKATEYTPNSISPAARTLSTAHPQLDVAGLK